MTPSERASCSLNDLPMVSALCGLLSCPTVSPCCAQAFGSRISLDIISGGAEGNGDTCGDCAIESVGNSAVPISSAIFNLGKWSDGAILLPSPLQRSSRRAVAVCSMSRFWIRSFTNFLFRFDDLIKAIVVLKV